MKMKCKRIMAIVAVVVVCVGLFCIPSFADGAKEWRQKADHSNIDVTYYGRVSWADEGIAPNLITYYAKLAGKDLKYIIEDNPARLIVRSGVMNNILLNLYIYEGHQYDVTQKSTTATYIKVEWRFDNYEENFTLK